MYELLFTHLLVEVSVLFIYLAMYEIGESARSRVSGASSVVDDRARPWRLWRAQTFEYSSLPSSFLFSPTLRTAFIKSSSTA